MWCRRKVAILPLVMMCLWPLAVSAEVELFAADKLIQAVKKADYSAAESLLARGHDPGARDGDRRSALQVAALAGNAEMVSLLIKYRAVTEYKDPLGNTALIYASNGGHVDAVAALIDGGAGPNTTNRQGLTPLMIAARQGYLAIVQVLLDHGADATMRDYTGRSALMWAEWNNRAPIVRQFQRAGIRE